MYNYHWSVAMVSDNGLVSVSEHDVVVEHGGMSLCRSDIQNVGRGK